MGNAMFEVLTAMKTLDCGLPVSFTVKSVNKYRRFGGFLCLHLFVRQIISLPTCTVV
jgi:hypothetical protein